MGSSHTPDRLVGDLSEENADTPLEDGTWYTATSNDFEIVYDIEPGSLADAEYLTFDLLLDDDTVTRWELRLHEGENGPTFRMYYNALNQCQARARIPLAATDQNR
ncbi:hypothetical protein, partial [Halococcus agarilyticus]|uniref:hypothetical protein n=1 Tax=Halococcus agarilyticus TaxID=1232219 RepID=UPI0012AB4E2F